MSDFNFSTQYEHSVAQSGATSQSNDLIDFDALFSSFKQPPSLTNSPFSITSSSSSPQQQLVTPQLLHSDTNDLLGGFPLFGGSAEGIDPETVKHPPEHPIDTSVFDGFSSLLKEASEQNDLYNKPSVSPPPCDKSRSSTIQSKRYKVGMSDPIQPRKYSSASATSRKKVPAAFESRVEGNSKKRSRGTVDDVPSDVQDAIESKRRQNTLAARKSRERKRNELSYLESQVEQLVEKNAHLTSRIECVAGLEEELRLVRLENEALKGALQL
ncbi:hypothetical protein E3P92_01252 [Wallemia ichthyophaga]|uniref:BZIP domain-containing protein n=1 Tax=Wallemia ichthyophaga TaxID=245174 RepID=A0A4T0F7W0_WALIC|nr:hypothetical protein E3P91_00959 [Wallemia ichthyophaga]TIA82954.1 hypothetical protein E3P98_01083 [Wallemia ichthyophaga]TIA96996.1 hypothetical protein E3P95_03057 [Wallemia ichthyophaga]TIA98278.1 hypothetical protein E3P94_02985 [Wallemia ichthyophaga]TIB06256.1 hypothetical protein E3P96_00624 [Wallemia ichthyophaga]